MNAHRPASGQPEPGGPIFSQNNFEPEQVAFCLDDDIGNANKLHDSGFKVFLKKNLGLYTHETLNKKLNEGIQIINGNILEIVYNADTNKKIKR